MGYNAKPERDWDHPHHQELSFRLKAKRELLIEVARQFTYGCATEEDLIEAAAEHTEAMISKANETIRRHQ